MDAGRNHIQSSMTAGWKCRAGSGRAQGDGESLGGGQERHRAKIISEKCIKGEPSNPHVKGKVEAYVRTQEKQRIGRGCGQKR